MSLIQRLRQAWQGLVGKKFSDKTLQKEMDLLETLIYLTRRKMPVGSSPDEAISHAEQISLEERQLNVKELVHEQVKSIMIALHMENDPQYAGSASRVDHSFDVRDSSMAGAGMGVFLRGNVRAGSVRALRARSKKLTRFQSQTRSSCSILDMCTCLM